MTRKQQFFTILILGTLSTISPFSIDMYLPGFPAIAKDLETTIEKVQLSLTAYLIGIAAGQLLYGPLLDRFGRKTPLYAGLAIYIFASLGCIITQSVESLIVMRFFQAVGGCAGMVAAQAMVRDFFPANKTAQVFSYMTLVIAISPMIAPTVGGYVTVAFGWHWVFLVLAVLAVLAVPCVHYMLPRGKRPDPTISLKPVAVLKNFFTVVRQPQFIVYSLAGAFATSAPFAFIAGSPNVFMNLYGSSEQEYGWTFAFVAGCIIATTQLNHIFLKRFRNEEVVKYALVYQTFVGALLVAAVLMNMLSQIGLILMCALFMAGHGLVNPNTNALSLAPFVRHTGSAASLLGSFRMAMGGLVSGLVSAFHSSSALPMIAVMVGCVVAGLLILATGKATVKYRARKKDVEADQSVINF
jgi:MFS transporter, DHA1 family, multidrug resistance protein